LALLSLTLLLSICLVSLPHGGAQAAPNLSNFDRARIYSGGFRDVSATAWYREYITGAYEFAIMSGRGDYKFNPGGRLTVAEAVSIATRLHRGFHEGVTVFERAELWYLPYVEYALQHGILSAPRLNYNAAITRADFAAIIAATLPAEAVTPINTVLYGAIPDVSVTFSYGPAVYKLYRAGVLTGSDITGRFYPGRTINRAEAAAVAMRMIDGDLRVSTRLSPLTAEEIYRLASPAVFYIEVFDREGHRQRTGSGFFISDTGLALTNHHVINGASTAHIITPDGETFEVIGMYDYSWHRDLALIQVAGGPHPYLELADSARLLTGATVYALGSPLGLSSTFSSGIVSATHRVIDGLEFIQTDAPISSGSSGGALLDVFGRVVGITSASAPDAQNINLAIPINQTLYLYRDEYVPLEELIPDVPFYRDFYPVPDFGAFAGVSRHVDGTARGGTVFSYLMSDLPQDPYEFYELIDEYMQLLEQHFFNPEGLILRNGNPMWMYYNNSHGILLMFGMEELDDGRDVFSLILSMPSH